jgi:hypothetical protein
LSLWTRRGRGGGVWRCYDALQKRRGDYRMLLYQLFVVMFKKKCKAKAFT